MGAGAARLEGARLLAVDTGARFCGLAARLQPLVGPQPYGHIERSSPCNFILNQQTSKQKTPFNSQADALWQVIQQNQIHLLVVGMPFAADSTRTKECNIVERTVDKWQASWPNRLPVLFWDESWSTRITASGRGRKFLSDPRSHSAVACLLLQEVLHPANERTKNWLERAYRESGVQ